MALSLLVGCVPAFTLAPPSMMQPRAALAHHQINIMAMEGAPPETAPVPEAFLKSRTPLLKDVSEYEAMYAKSINDPDAFWSEIANTFHWETPFDKVVDANFAASKGKVESKWFSGGKTNICYNALDRHVAAGHGDQVAFYHEANDEDEEMAPWTYAETLAEVERLANVLKSKGVKPGDRVSIFMPMIPQLPMAMLACARIGAVHSVVFGGFSAEALASRIMDAKSTVVITANGVMRGKKPSEKPTFPRRPKSAPRPTGTSPELTGPCPSIGSRSVRHCAEGLRDL